MKFSTTPAAAASPGAPSGASLVSGLSLAAGVLLGILPLLFVRGTQDWFSSAPAVWIYSLGFTMTMVSLGLIAGSLASRKLASMGVRWLQVLLLLGAGASMPLLPGAESVEVAPPNAAAALLQLLLVKAGPLSVALGCFLGVRFDSAEPEVAELAALVGLLAGQLAFLVLLDPLLTTPAINSVYAWCVLGFALAAIVWLWRAGPAAANLSGTQSGEPASARARWLSALLAGALVAMLIVVSARTMANAASTPKLWVLPVLIAVIGFTIGRSRPGLHRPRVIASLQVISAIALTLSLYAGPRWSPMMHMQVLYAGLGSGVLAGSAALARLRGGTGRGFGVSPWIVIVIAVTAVTYVAQRFGTDITEFHVTVLASSALVWLALMRRDGSKGAFFAGLAGVVLLAAALGFNWHGRNLGIVGRVRTFYGVTSAQGMGAGADAYLLMRNGDAVRAAQFVARDAGFEPTLYHGRNTGIGLLFGALTKGNFRRVGIVGIGNGDLVAYAHPTDVFQFYEYDPGPVLMAERQFAYLPHANFDWKLVAGDPRRVLERAEPEKFDILILDTFSAGALPFHLLTAEAFAIWKKHLAADGVLAINVTNDRFNLLPVVWRQAIELELTMFPAFTAGDPAKGSVAAEWVFLTSDRELIRKTSSLQPPPADAEQAKSFPLWTDETANPLGMLR